MAGTDERTVLCVSLSNVIGEKKNSYCSENLFHVYTRFIRSQNKYKYLLRYRKTRQQSLNAAAAEYTFVCVWMRRETGPKNRRIKVARIRAKYRHTKNLKMYEKKNGAIAIID